MAQAKSVRARQSHGLTLVEMLVAMTCTLLLMLAITQTFQNIGEVSAKGRAGIEMSTQLRGVWLKLQEDLQGLTVPVRPWPDADGAAGYFEYQEGTSRDNSFVNDPMNNLMGDPDDILAMTCRTTGTPFVGRSHTGMLESNVAEVIWFSQLVDTNGNNTFDVGEGITLHRRVLLVRPDLNDATTGIYRTGVTLADHYQQSDISVRQAGGDLIANSLADLTQRENRFAHVDNFPTRFDVNATSGLLNTGWVLTGDRQGEDVILSNVIAFDVRAFDRTAIVQLNNGEPVSPGDPGYGATANTNIGVGAFADLNHNTGVGEFTGLPQAKSGLGAIPVYDTWSYKYEHDGINQDGDNWPAGFPQVGQPMFDEGTDGIDNDNNGIVDDVNERETSPPYPVPLRAIQVRLRVVERDTRQVRQATLVQDFLPE